MFGRKCIKRCRKGNLGPSLSNCKKKMLEDVDWESGKHGGTWKDKLEEITEE